MNTHKEKWTICIRPWIGQRKYGQRVISARKEHTERSRTQDLATLPDDVKLTFELQQPQPTNPALWTIEPIKNYRDLAIINDPDWVVTRRGLNTYITGPVIIQEPEDPLLEMDSGPTDPYGILAYIIGNEDEFVCFDFAILDDNRVVIHSAVNSETGSFLDRFRKSIVKPSEAIAEAQDQIDAAWEWCSDIELDYLSCKDAEERLITNISDALKARGLL